MFIWKWAFTWSLTVYEKLRNLLVEVYKKRWGNISFRSVKRPKELTGAFYGCEKVEKSFRFCDLFTVKRRCI